MKMYIYVLKDPVTNKIRYVGQAINLELRFRKHIENSKDKSFKRHVYNWIRSLDKLPIIECIEECNVLVVNEREKYWIKYYRDLGYDLCNHSNGGEGAGIGNKNCLGRKLSNETKEKLRRANKQGRKTLHISSNKIYPTLKEACKELNLHYVNEFYKLKRGTSKTFAYLPNKG